MGDILNLCLWTSELGQFNCTFCSNFTTITLILRCAGLTEMVLQDKFGMTTKCFIGSTTMFTKVLMRFKKRNSLC